MEAERVVRLRDLRTQFRCDRLEILPEWLLALRVEEVHTKRLLDARQFLARLIKRARAPRKEAEANGIDQLRGARAARHGGSDDAGQTCGKFRWHGVHLNAHLP